MTLENLVGKGLQREAISAAEIRRFHVKIDTKLADARSEGISLDSRFDLAYEALLQIGLTALRANNLRPDSRGGQDKVLRQKHIPVTGGAGFIGSHACVALAQAGQGLVILDNLRNSRADVIDRLAKVAIP